MANYNLVIGAKFRPFSYQELLAPALMMTQAHQQLEDQYAEISSKANIWDKMANEQADPKAHAIYKKYADDLKEKADYLSKYGLDVSSRQELNNMRARYSSDIIPIENAYRKREEQAKVQQEAMLRDPTLLLSRKAATTSLDDYMANPQLDYEAYSGKLLTAQTAQAAGALAKEMRANPRKWRSILGNSYYETMMQKGFSSKEVLKAIQNNPKAAPELHKIVEDAIDSSGIRDWKDEAILKKAYGYAREGLWNSVGETQYQNLDNWRAKLAAQEAMQQRAEERQRQMNKLTINPLNIYSPKELSAEEKKFNDTVKAYTDAKYFEKVNGEWKLTKKGWEAYHRKVPELVGNTTVTPEGIVILTGAGSKYTSSPFKKFMDSLGVKGLTPTGYGKWQASTAGAAWSKYLSNSPASRLAKYDATKVTEYDYPIDSSQQDDMKNAIMTAGRGLNLKEVDYDSKSKRFQEKGGEITMEDLKDNKYKVTNTRFSPYGNTVMIQDDKGNVRRFRMPEGINTTNEQNRDRAMQAAINWQQVITTGQYIDSKGRVHQATPNEINHAQQQYENSIQQAYLYHSKLGVQNKIKYQEFKP